MPASFLMLFSSSFISFCPVILPYISSNIFGSKFPNCLVYTCSALSLSGAFFNASLKALALATSLPTDIVGASVMYPRSAIGFGSVLYVFIF